jgi:hypothetical protein
MYITKKNLKGTVFESTIVLLEYFLKWESIYMDPDNELAISFSGKLNERQIATVIRNFLDIIVGDYSGKIEPQEGRDYVIHYHNGWHTQVFTPNGWDFKALTGPKPSYDEDFHRRFREIMNALEERGADFDIDKF